MTKADPALLDDVEKLRKLSVAEFWARFFELFGEETTSRNEDFLFKRIVYRMQERKYGGLTPATIAGDDAGRGRADPTASLRERGGTTRHAGAAPRSRPTPPAPGRGTARRLGRRRARRHRPRRRLHVPREALKSLSMTAREISGTSWNGYGFFGLLQKASAA